jgi:hypothetical protein
MKGLLWSIAVCVLVICAIAVLANIPNDAPTPPPEAPPKIEHKVQKDMVSSEFGGPTIYLLGVDGCEYILVERGDMVTLIHKENCKNPAHRPPEWEKPKPDPKDKEKICL